MEAGMPPRTSLVLVFLALGAPLYAQTAQTQSASPKPEEIYKSSSPGVVLIETYGTDGKVAGSGSGFLVSADGKILTNYHVIQHTNQATVRLANEDAYDTVEVIDVDKRKDIALLKIKAVSLPFLKLGHSNTAQVGDKVYALGNPLGVFQNTLSDGILSGIRQMDGYKLFQISAPVSHGSSGSPVFDSSGEVIAIVEATLSEGQNLNFAIPIDYAAGMLGSNQTHPLESVSEPEEPDKSGDTKDAASDSKSAPTAQPAASPSPAPTPSQAFQQDAITYISNKMGIWTKPDAEIELGSPTDRRDGIFRNEVVSDIYKYNLPFSNFGAVELSISRTTGKLVAAYFYYRTNVSWAQVEAKLGKKFKKVKLPKGQPGEGYVYQFGQHQVYILIDSAGMVRNVGVW